MALVIAFAVLATANAAGYRYGASDEAFYIPAVLRHVDPVLFPRDAALIDSQSKLTVVDEVLGAIVRSTGISLPHLFLALYLLTLALLALALMRIARTMYASRWASIALLAALTLRHAIAQTGANTLESYFHPRQLAFALGLWAVAMFLERRIAGAIALLAAAAAIHPTTAALFVLWLGVAAAWERRDWRVPALALGGAAALAAGWALWRGPLAGHLVRMDVAWLSVIADKGYLFPAGWSLSAWATNLITIPIVAFGYRARARQGAIVPGETALLAGAMALVVAFAAWLPFNAAHVALAVQLQVSRVFWMLDVWATVYLVWWLSTPRRAFAIAALLVLLSAGRGGYTMFVQFPDRPLFAVDLGHKDWRDAMAWARTTDPRSGWLADPLHAARYGSSLRAAGWRDVFLEELKDTAIAMYDRSIAMRVADREQALRDMPWNTADGARGLARRYDLDYLVIDAELPLPLAHRAGSLFIYKLR